MSCAVQPARPVLQGCSSTTGTAGARRPAAVAGRQARRQAAAAPRRQRQHVAVAAASASQATPSPAASSSSAPSAPTDVEYDAVIIGSGMGGLSTAAQMAAKGAKVVVLEK